MLLSPRASGHAAGQLCQLCCYRGTAEAAVPATKNPWMPDPAPPGLSPQAYAGSRQPVVFLLPISPLEEAKGTWFSSAWAPCPPSRTTWRDGAHLEKQRVGRGRVLGPAARPCLVLATWRRRRHPRSQLLPGTGTTWRRRLPGRGTGVLPTHSWCPAAAATHGGRSTPRAARQQQRRGERPPQATGRQLGRSGGTAQPTSLDRQARRWEGGTGEVGRESSSCTGADRPWPSLGRPPVLLGHSPSAHYLQLLRCWQQWPLSGHWPKGARPTQDKGPPGAREDLPLPSGRAPRSDQHWEGTRGAEREACHSDKLPVTWAHAWAARVPCQDGHTTRGSLFTDSTVQCPQTATRKPFT